jgi:hypothetical protein
MSQVNEWDNNNVVLTGGTDGVIRMWSLGFTQVQDTELGEEVKLVDGKEDKKENSFFPENFNAASDALLSSSVYSAGSDNTPNLVQSTIGNVEESKVDEEEKRTPKSSMSESEATNSLDEDKSQTRTDSNKQDSSISTPNPSENGKHLFEFIIFQK